MTGDERLPEPSEGPEGTVEEPAPVTMNPGTRRTTWGSPAPERESRPEAVLHALRVAQ
jgi:hypothetical protein